MAAAPFAFVPSALALGLSAATGRPVINKSVPKAARDGRPLNLKADVPGAFGNARREKLLAAVARFNAG